MKPVHESSTVVITSPQQRQFIEQLMSKHLEEGGSLIAQVFPDGIKLRVLTPQQSKELQSLFVKAFGGKAPTKIAYSVFDKPKTGGAA